MPVDATVWPLWVRVIVAAAMMSAPFVTAVAVRSESVGKTLVYGAGLFAVWLGIIAYAQRAGRRGRH